jgi:hypothetical protein
LFIVVGVVVVGVVGGVVVVGGGGGGRGVGVGGEGGRVGLSLYLKIVMLCNIDNTFTFLN